VWIPEVISSSVVDPKANPSIARRTARLLTVPLTPPKEVEQENEHERSEHQAAADERTCSHSKSTQHAFTQRFDLHSWILPRQSRSSRQGRGRQGGALLALFLFPNARLFLFPS